MLSLTRNWRPIALAVALAGLVALPALAAAYEKSGLIVPNGSHVKAVDNSALRFGDGSGGATDPTSWDASIRWDGTDLDVLANADDSVLKFGNGTESWDVWFYGNTATEYIVWDASADDLIFQDNVSAKFGNDGDVEIRWDGTNMDVLAATDDYQIYWGDGTKSFDQRFYGNAATTYISWDASADDLKFEDSTSLMFGTGAGAGQGNAGDVEIRWDATDLDILAAADDSVIKVGNGTNSFDWWHYGNTASDYLLIDASANQISTQGDMYLLLNDARHNLVAKTSNYTVAATDSATVFTNEGASGAVTFTLPATGSEGLVYEFMVVADQTVTIDGPADTLIIFNDAAADSVSFSTSGEKIGNHVRAVATDSGSKWFLEINPASDSVSVTTAT